MSLNTDLTCNPIEDNGDFKTEYVMPAYEYVWIKGGSNADNCAR